MVSQKLDEHTTDHARYQPTVRDMVMLDAPLDVKVSPDGKWVAANIRSANWKDDRYDNVCYVYDTANGNAHRMNHTGSVNQMEWVADDTLALLKQSGGEEKAQIWLYEGLFGEGWQVTDHKTGVQWFKPFADGFLFKGKHPERDENKSRADRFGKFTHFEQEESASALYYVGIEAMREYQAQVRAATEDEAKALIAPVIELSQLLSEPLAIQGVVPAPTNDAVYLNCWPRDDLVYYRNTRTYCITLDAPAALAAYLEREKAKKAAPKDAAPKDNDESPIPENEAKKEEDFSYLGTITRLNLPNCATVNQVSPNGRKLLINYPERDTKMYTREDMWVADADAVLHAASAADGLAQMRNISAPLDRCVLESHWAASGIYAAYVDSTAIRLAHFDEDGHIIPLDMQGIFIANGFHISASGHIALVGANAETYPEVYFASPTADCAQWQAKSLSDFGQAVENWDLGTVETIRWTSKDGTEIEGVLRKPANFDPQKQYPLVFLVHGGPSWFSPAYLLTLDECYYYPAAQFLNKDVLILHPNYRGSIGRGQSFVELNVNNLGIGDLWDLESAIEDLVAKGLVDAERVGCMGWSQGGYISAFAGLHSDKFKAVSVGAGIADWYTYHISNDIPDFTVDYLSGSPFHDRDLYVKTAPISNLAHAHTPMLIQHGSEDRRVPLSNAMELYRGLRAMNVPVELFVYPGMGHPITKPRENHAVMHQNLIWFSHYLLGEELTLE
jgi:dipeptidyl aminopeptidase/acylaminoacyl peptidase